MFGRGERILKGLGAVVGGVGELTGDDNLRAAGQDLRNAGKHMPGVREEARTGLPALGRAAGEALGEGVFKWLDDAPGASKDGGRHGS